MFKSLLAKAGIGGARVDTRLGEALCIPGGILPAEVEVKGGSVAQEIGGIRLVLCTRAKRESDEGVSWHEVELASYPVVGAFTVGAEETRRFPVQLPIPHETPVNLWNGLSLPCEVYVRTRLDIRGAIDASDADPVRVQTLPTQARILEAFGRLGMRYSKADVELGTIAGSSMPCFQEIEFSAYGVYGSQVQEVEVTFLARPGGLRVVLEIDRRKSGIMGMFGGSHDDILAFDVDDAQIHGTPWEQTIDGLIRSRIGSYSSSREHSSFY